MKILYDHQIFESQSIGGISRYFAELIIFNPASEISIKYSDNLYLSKEYIQKHSIFSKNHERDKFFPYFNFKGKGRLFRYYSKIFRKNNQAISTAHLKYSNFDIFHPTYYNPYFLQYLKGKPFVLTVHDMIHEIFPQYFLNDKHTVLNKKKLILAANRINVNSEQTKKDLLHFFPEVEDKIKVIYHAFALPFLIPKKKENFILFTGMRSKYKNFEYFVQAVAPLLTKHDLRLICTGQPFSNVENLLLENLGISDRIILKFASDEELSELYAKSIAFVFPSLYEGFGIPILEAFASQCPAILSNTSSLPEIGGNAAVYFDPYSIEDMRNKIENVICSPTLQNEMIQKGIERVKQFSWEKCAKETMEVYKSVLERKS